MARHQSIGGRPHEDGVHLASTFETFCKIHPVANHPQIQTVTRAHITKKYRCSVNADAQRINRLVAFGSFEVARQVCSLNLNGTTKSLVGMVRGCSVRFKG